MATTTSATQAGARSLSGARRGSTGGLRDSMVLGGRAIREALRTPDSLVPTIFIPLFFLVVNVGQASRIFPSKETPFLEGQSYGAFQLPVSMLLSASFGGAALFLVEEIERGYFDKLRATPISRMALVLGRLYAEFVKTMVVSMVMVLLAFVFGIRIESGILGFVVLIVLVSAWSMAFSGFMQLIALKTRSAAATQGASMIFFPLLFLTPNFVPRDQLARPMEIAATINPVTYIMEAARSLILEGFDWTALAKGFAVVAVAMVLMLAMSVRMVNRYD
jgi:ABC-2 type transport system permease protein